jgi:hypothetical protein
VVRALVLSRDSDWCQSQVRGAIPYRIRGAGCCVCWWILCGVVAYAVTGPVEGLLIPLIPAAVWGGDLAYAIQSRLSP